MPAAFGCPLREFDSSTVLEKVGSLIATAAAAGFATHYMKQTEAWREEITILGQAAGSHSKKTMTAATTLYGVTMQESGVSKRVPSSSTT